MHSRNSLERWLLAALCVSAALLGVVWFASSANAQTVVILDMPGRAGQANTGLLRGELESRGLYTVYAQGWFYDRAASLGIAEDGLLDIPDSLIAAAQGSGAERVDAIIGPVSASRRGLIVEVYNGSTGTSVGTVTFPVRRGRLVGKTARPKILDLEALIGLTGWPEEEMTFATEEPSLDALIEDPTEELVPEALGPAYEGAWFEVQTGVSMVKRDFALQSSTEELTYSSSFYPGLYLGGDAYPLLALYGDTKWWSRFGFTGHFMRGSDDVSIDEGTGPRTVPVTHQDLGLGVVYRYTLEDNLTLRFGTGADFVDFVLADNPYYSSTTYRAFWVATHAFYRWTDTLTLRGGVQLLPVVSLSESEGDFGEDSSTFGVAVDARVQYALFSGVHAQLGWRLLMFQSSFEGVGVRRLEEVETTDLFNDLSLWLGYEL